MHVIAILWGIRQVFAAVCLFVCLFVCLGLVGCFVCLLVCFGLVGCVVGISCSEESRALTDTDVVGCFCSPVSTAAVRTVLPQLKVN